MTTRIVVTGAAGFAGGHLLDALAASGETDLEGWRRPGNHAGATAAPVAWRDVDVLDAGAVRRALEESRPSVIYHLAGAPHVGQSWAAVRHTLETNVLGTHRLLEADRVLQLGARILVTGSAAIYRGSTRPLTEDDATVPATPYGLSKLAQEQLAMRAGAAEGQRVFVTRSFNHIGPRQSPDFAASSFARQIALAEIGKGPAVLKVGNLATRRDFSDVRDTVRAYMAIVERGRPGVPYNVCSGIGTTMQSLLDHLVALACVPLTIERDPALYRPADTAYVIGDGTRLRRDTGWAPRYPLDRTLEDLLAYWRASVS